MAHDGVIHIQHQYGESRTKKGEYDGYSCNETYRKHNTKQEWEKHIGIGEQVYFIEKRDFGELNRIPEWMRVEHMEMCEPLAKLRKCYDLSEEKDYRTIFIDVFDKIRRLRK